VFLPREGQARAQVVVAGSAGDGQIAGVGGVARQGAWPVLPPTRQGRAGAGRPPPVWRRAKLGGIIRPHGLRHAAITAALDETNGNVRAAREFSGHASIEVLMRYDDNRKDVGGGVASKVIRRLAKLFNDEKLRTAGDSDT
jgi:hypothetical protein